MKADQPAGRPGRPALKTRLRRRFNTWLLQHAQALVGSLGQYLRYPAGNLLTTAVIGIALALPAGFYLLLDNARALSGHWDGPLQITLFLHSGIGADTAAGLSARLAADPAINKATLIGRAEALAEYQNLSGFKAALDLLDDNPLPDVISLEPVIEGASEARIEQLIAGLKALPEVDSAYYDSQWIERLLLLLELIRRAVIILSILLSGTLLLIVGNTIRLALFSRRAEIEITKLFGGTDRFIRRPFLYSGLWHGLFGGIMAWLLVAVSLRLLQGPVRQLARLHGADFDLAGPGVVNSLVLIGIAIMLGLCGAWLSVKRHLSAIEPR